MKVSFIVPIYNVASYLRKCVDSLLAQDNEDYEIILVDDGSTDESPKICDDYVSSKELKSERIRELENPLIRVIHQKNGGLSAARNSGIKVAQGEYVCFVDSDDYWQPNVLGSLMEQIECEQLDVLRFNYQNVNAQYEVFYPNKDPKRDVDYSAVVTDGEAFLNERLGPACYAWQFVVKRKLLNKCLFKEGIYFEDTEWTPRMLLRAKRVASTSMIAYNYLWRSGSITLPTDPIKHKKVLEDKIKLLYGFQEESSFATDHIWFKWMISMTTMGVLGMLARMSAVERKPYLNELRSLQIFPLYSKKEKILSHKIKIMLANISPSLYCILMSLRR